MRRSSAKKKGYDFFKKIEEERKTSQAVMQSIWDEVTQNKNTLEVLIEISLNSEYQDKIQTLKLERVKTLYSSSEEIKKIIQEKLNSIQIGLSNFIDVDIVIKFYFLS